MNWRKWNKIIHRDLGYIFFAMTIIYAVSGIAINHINDWNPNYNIEKREFELNTKIEKENIDKDFAIEILKRFNEQNNYKKHYFPKENTLKIFIKEGSVLIDLVKSNGLYEKISRRPILHQFNYLHYNPGKWWTYFSDIFCVALVLLSISGLFIIRGKNGIKGRGAWLTSIGILIPILFLLLYY